MVPTLKLIANTKQIMLLKHTLKTNYAFALGLIRLGQAIDKLRELTNNCRGGKKVTVSLSAGKHLSYSSYHFLPLEAVSAPADS